MVDINFEPVNEHLKLKTMYILVNYPFRKSFFLISQSSLLLFPHFTLCKSCFSQRIHSPREIFSIKNILTALSILCSLLPLLGAQTLPFKTCSLCPEALPACLVLRLSLSFQPLSRARPTTMGQPEMD